MRLDGDEENAKYFFIVSRFHPTVPLLFEGGLICYATVLLGSLNLVTLYKKDL